MLLHADESMRPEQQEIQTRGHIIDILEESGPHLVKHCYWDFGRWSDLWRIWRPVGADRPFRETPIILGVCP